MVLAVLSCIGNAIMAVMAIIVIVQAGAGANVTAVSIAPIVSFKAVIILKAMAFLNLSTKKFKSWARKRPAISDSRSVCKLRLKKVVIDEIQLSKNTR